MIVALNLHWLNQTNSRPFHILITNLGNLHQKTYTKIFFFFHFLPSLLHFFLKYILTVFTQTSPPDLTQPNPISSPPSPVNPISSSPTILIYHSFINKAVMIISSYIINQHPWALDQLSSCNIHPVIFPFSNFLQQICGSSGPTESIKLFRTQTSFKRASPNTSKYPATLGHYYQTHSNPFPARMN